MAQPPVPEPSGFPTTFGNDQPSESTPGTQSGFAATFGKSLPSESTAGTQSGFAATFGKSPQGEIFLRCLRCQATNLLNGCC